MPAVTSLPFPTGSQSVTAPQAAQDGSHGFARRQPFANEFLLEERQKEAAKRQQQKAILDQQVAERKAQKEELNRRQTQTQATEALQPASQVGGKPYAPDRPHMRVQHDFLHPASSVPEPDAGDGPAHLPSPAPGADFSAGPSAACLPSQNLHNSNNPYNDLEDRPVGVQPRKNSKASAVSSGAVLSVSNLRRPSFAPPPALDQPASAPALPAGALASPPGSPTDDPMAAVQGLPIPRLKAAPC